jgi:hypothetical protein
VCIVPSKVRSNLGAKNGGTMKSTSKSISILAVSALIFALTAAPAQAATKTIQIGRHVTLQVPTSITIPEGECADLRVKFKITNGINYPYQFVDLYLSKNTGMAVIYPGSDWSGPLDGFRGTKIVKLCKYDWFDEEEEEEHNAIKNGRYTFKAGLVQLQPLKVLNSQKITITVRG